MNVYQVRGYPHDHFFVQTHEEWQVMQRWLHERDIDVLQQSSSMHGIGFSIRDYRGQKGHEMWFRTAWEIEAA